MIDFKSTVYWDEVPLNVNIVSFWVYNNRVWSENFQKENANIITFFNSRGKLKNKDSVPEFLSNSETVTYTWCSDE